MEPILYTAAAVLAVTALVHLIARAVNVPSPILLVVVGALIAVTPGVPRIALPPNLVLLVFLPPLIYYAAFGMSWRAFCMNLRPIVLLAFGCVVFTTVIVAAVAHWLVGFPWPVAFILGAIVSPPDTVAPLAIARRLGVPRRITAILEGEGLVNDATALVLFKFALVAALTGAFSLMEATVTFAAIVVGETAYGLLVGFIMLRLRHWARDPLVEVTLSLLTPFVAFWLPHETGGSGVLATVVAGLYVGAKGVELIRSNTRLQALFFWGFVTYLIEGAIFLLTGLQASTVLQDLDRAHWGRVLMYVLAISTVVITARFVWVFPATYLPRMLWPRLRQRDPAPPWQHAFMVAFTGIRGVVSLAAALSIPLTLATGEPFPDRGLILLMTFSVIVVTLVLQGPTLPWVVNRLGLMNAGREEAHQRERLELQVRVESAQAALDALDSNEAARGLSAEDLQRLRQTHLDRLTRLKQERDDYDEDGSTVSADVDRAELGLIKAARGYLNRQLRDGRIEDETRRHIERELDLHEEAVRRDVE